MKDPKMAEFALIALTLVAKAMPGLLAALTGKQNDEEALEAARAEIEKIDARPAGNALDAYQDKVTKP